MTAIGFRVWGIAQAQGSARAFMPKGGKFPIITSDNKKLRPWRALVSTAAGDAVAAAGAQLIPAGHPVRVVVAVYLPRPKAIGAKDVPHTKAPDIDKIARGLADGMSGIVYADDSQITEWKVTKSYAAPGEAPHAAIVVTPL